MLLIDEEGRPWWCPDLKATDVEEIEKRKREYTKKEHQGYEGLWNINPGADRAED